MQHQKLPPEVLEALDTEAWFRERVAEVPGIGPAAGAQSPTRPSKEALFDEAIAWYLAQAATGPAVDWPHPARHWPKVTFWVSDTLVARCARLAREHRIARSQVMTRALMLYCDRQVPRVLMDFRGEAFEKARTLYRAVHTPAHRRRPSPRKP